MQLKNNNLEPIVIESIVMYEKSLDVDEADCTFLVVEDEGSIGPNNIQDVNFDINDEIMSTVSCGLLDNAGNKKTFVVKVKSSPASSEISSFAVGEMTLNVNEFDGLEAYAINPNAEVEQAIINVLEKPPVDPDVECTIDSDCDAEGICYENTCLFLVGLNAACNIHTDCAHGYCVNNRCSASCTDHTDCNPGYCVGGNCYVAASSN